MTLAGYTRLSAGLMAVGAILQLWQYLANSSLWINEAAVARIIIERRVGDLFGPLDYAQVAPPGFLLVEKGAISVFGPGEYALRLFPVLCGLASLVLFRVVAKRALRGAAVPFAVGLFALGAPFIYFPSQVKQYSSDVAASLFVLLAALEIRAQGLNSSRAAFWIAAGAAMVWFSQTAVFVLLGAGASLVALAWLERDRSVAKPLILLGLLWGPSAAAVVGLSLFNTDPTDRAYLQRYWAEGFMPMPPRDAGDFAWLWKQLTYVFGAFFGQGRMDGGLHYPWSSMFVLVMLTGFWSLWQRRRDIALFLAAPVVLTLAASAAKLYPFNGRLLVFLIPTFLLATAEGGAYLFSVWPRRLQFLTPAGLALLVGAPVYAAALALPPNRPEHLRPVLEYVTAHRQPADAVYVYYGAGQSFLYYAPRFGFDEGTYTVGRCAVEDPRAYLRELDAFRGRRRLWLIATHLLFDGREHAFIAGYLDRIGRRVDSKAVVQSYSIPVARAYGYLYDLSDPVRLALASAETYPIPYKPPDSDLSRLACYGTQSPYASRSDGAAGR